MPKDLFATPSIVACVTEIVASHVSNNSVPVAEIPTLITSVHATLARLDPSLVAPGGIMPLPVAGSDKGLFQFSDVQPLTVVPETAPTSQPVQKPAVPIEESVQHDYIVCLEDGKRLRMMKRYLRTKFGMTPDDYRAKWGLPRNYPMAAPAVIEQRRGHATTVKLGKRNARRSQPASM